MDFLKSMKIAASALRAQSGRMRVIAENLANSGSTSEIAGGTPYRRKIPTFKQVYDRELGVQVVRSGPVRLDTSDFGLRHEPGHPAADDKGYIRTANVNTLVETTDMREAQRTYEANLNVISATRRMLSRTLDILRA